MSRDDSLLDENISPEAMLEQTASAVYRYLEKLSCDAFLRRKLNAAATLLDQEKYDDYLKHPAVVDAMRVQKESRCYFLPKLWQQSSPYEKTFLALSLGFLVADLGLLYESIVLDTQGSNLRITGAGIAHYCTGGLTNPTTSICSQLPADYSNTTAVFNLNYPTNLQNPPSFVGSIDPASTSVPGTELQTVNSWFNPIAWKNFWTCVQNGPVLTLEGHAFQGTKAQAAAQIVNGRFLTYATQTLIDVTDAVLRNAGVRLAISEFFITFCIRMKEGGASTHVNANGQYYGLYNGFQETFGEDFKTYGYGFGIPYGILSGIAALILTVLIIQKAILNSGLSSLKTQAHRLYAQHGPTVVDAAVTTRQQYGAVN